VGYLPIKVGVLPINSGIFAGEIGVWPMFMQVLVE
jgi:hypothetical protein